MRKNDEVILPTSEQAAIYRTGLSGWVGRHGMYWGDNPDSERLARYASSTHGQCDCGSVCNRGWTKCDPCRNAADAARYRAMPEAEWDGVAMIYSQSQDKYYRTPSEAEEELEDEEDGRTLGDLQLIICAPNYARELGEDFFCDELPEDGDLPNNVIEALEKFNAAIKGTILSWSPGRHRLKLEQPNQGMRAKMAHSRSD